MRLLEHDDARRLQDAIAQARPFLQVRRREPTGLRGDAAHDEPAVCRRAAGLVDEHVRALLRQQLTAACAEQPQGDLVRHRRCRNEESGLLPEQLGCTTLELVHRRILAPLLIAELGRRDRRVHLSRRLRGGVGAEVDHAPSLAAHGGRGGHRPLDKLERVAQRERASRLEGDRERLIAQLGSRLRLRARGTVGVGAAVAGTDRRPDRLRRSQPSRRLLGVSLRKRERRELLDGGRKRLRRVEVEEDPHALAQVSRALVELAERDVCRAEVVCTFESPYAEPSCSA